ncbi:vWA domain-containing protein [Nonomuraea aridisoli]|uniref:VWA domain-containing protein n=1 Tax=Nonomuraea aridisoli TaxID=2070368 RepID=A0A2W2DA56_9ACTN|nr:vWA domain-containing protein [Nonomuraea aridisoli]PZG08922.1 hypothetical protein C1J01_38415 [Nonomuraea aridisoli]
MTPTTEGWRHIELVIDRSLSMHSIKTATEQGVRAFLAEQHRTVGRTTVSLTQFDDEVELVYAHCDLAKVPEFTLTPHGNTALLDAIGHTITRTRRFVRGRPKTDRPDEIITVILTDGYENASQAFDLPSVRELISEQRGKRRVWTFVLLGANEAVHTLARRLGIDAGTAIQYDHDLSEAALSTAGQMVSRAGETGTYGFTDDERRTTRH